ncbi:MAG: GGDEF domain-containing protein [Oligoflexia bacterium]|nr:GGDEF domain-containing protein [Oligoflexia bacterium]
MSHKHLLNFSIELHAAREDLAVVDAFSRYLQERFPNSTVSHEQLLEGEKAVDFYVCQDSSHYVCVDLSQSVKFVIKDCNQKLDVEEIDLLQKIFQSYTTKMEDMARLRGLTYTDDVTGLFNQRYLEVILDREISLAKRNDTQFSVLFLDLDHFKKINDSHGHLVGSKILFEVGIEIKKTLRESDITFRYGGDEFVVILSHTGLEDAVFVAERIRQQIEKKRFLARESLDIRLTASIGVATVPIHAVSKSEILKAADEALYGVKKAVRNKVIAATSSKSEG